MKTRHLTSRSGPFFLFLVLFVYAGFTDAREPACHTIAVVSSIDSATRHARFCGRWRVNAPLLVYFPSWSGGHPNFDEVSKLIFKHDWNMIAPKPRGANEGEIGSELAIQDVLDAIDEIGNLGNLRSKKIYALGVSGGGVYGIDDRRETSPALFRCLGMGRDDRLVRMVGRDVAAAG
jgi:hypothetical protein